MVGRLTGTRACLRRRARGPGASPISKENRMYTSETYLLNSLIVAAMIGLIPAAIAHSKGKSFFGWWFFGAALFIVALPAALLVKPDIVALEHRRIAQGTMKRCIHCAELIRQEATVCKYCGRDLSTVEAAAKVEVLP